MIKKFLKFLRFKHWIKNLFVFAPIIFAGRLFDLASFKVSLLAFGGFCFVASSVYIINDLCDFTADRLHPLKNHGFLENVPHFKIYYVFLSVGFLLLGTLLCLQVGWGVTLAVLVYFLMNLAYSFYIKKIIFVDVLFIAVGFQLRIIAGALAAHVELSSWIQICAFLLALFLGFSKRRREQFILKDKAAQYRPTLRQYSDRFLDIIIITLSLLTALSYVLYCLFSPVPHKLGEKAFLFSAAFVILGIARYLYLTYFRKDRIDFAEVLFSDIPLFLILFLWVSYILALLYLGA